MTELSPLQITAQHIRGLAKVQNDVADGISDARDMAGFVGERVAVSHGSICAATATAVVNAQAERTRAANRVRDQSLDLAVKLEHAAAKYDEIDAQEKGILDQQMPAGGR